VKNWDAWHDIRQEIHHFLPRASFAGLFGTPAVTEKQIFLMFVRGSLLIQTAKLLHDRLEA
jgi:hypothetical protein